MDNAMNHEQTQCCGNCSVARQMQSHEHARFRARDAAQKCKSTTTEDPPRTSVGAGGRQLGAWVSSACGWLLLLHCWLLVAAISAEDTGVHAANFTTTQLMTTSTNKVEIKEKPPEVDQTNNHSKTDSTEQKHNDTTLKFGHFASHEKADKKSADTGHDLASTTVLTTVLTTGLSSTSAITLNSTISTSTTVPSTVQATTKASIPTPVPTRRKIYHRGHLIESKSPRTFHPASPQSLDEEVSTKGPLPQAHVALPGEGGEDLCPPTSKDCEYGEGGEGEKGGNNDNVGEIKGSARRQNVVYNKKVFHDITKNTGGRRSTEFYAWLFGAAMLGIVVLVILIVSAVVCFFKWKKRRAQRRRWDKSGEYERVDSVSSIVDNTYMSPHGDMDPDNDQLDAVSII